MAWTEKNLTSQQGKIAIITGANSGIGLSTAKALAGSGAKIIMACRSEARAQQAIAQIKDHHQHADCTFMPLDLASLASVSDFAGHFAERYAHCDLLINNAGLMMPPKSYTDDGFELQLGVNFLGHFALTGHLLPVLEKADNARIVTLSSLAHHDAKLFRDNFNAETSYKRYPFYQQSKLACLIFALELHRRLQKQHSSICSLSAHPGITSTELLDHYPLVPLLMKLILQSADAGAQPTLQAATDPQAQGGDYYGPQGKFEYRGPSGKAKISRTARDPEQGEWLWQKAQALTGLEYL